MGLGFSPGSLSNGTNLIALYHVLTRGHPCKVANHLSWFLSIWCSSGCTPRLSRIVKIFTLFLANKPRHPTEEANFYYLILSDLLHELERDLDENLYIHIQKGLTCWGSQVAKQQRVHPIVRRLWVWVWQEGISGEEGFVYKGSPLEEPENEKSGQTSEVVATRNGARKWTNGA